MKEKFKNLSTPVGIVLSIVAVILFTGLLLGLAVLACINSVASIVCF